MLRERGVLGLGVALELRSVDSAVSVVRIENEIVPVAIRRYMRDISKVKYIVLYVMGSEDDDDEDFTGENITGIQSLAIIETTGCCRRLQ